MNFFRRFLAAMARQISIILALAAYENDRKSTSSSVGSWESLINPLQMMLFFIVIRLGFRFLMSGGSFAGSATNLYFNIVIFMAAGFTIYFPFRQLAIQALSGLKLRSPLYYRRVIGLLSASAYPHKKPIQKIGV